MLYYFLKYVKDYAFTFPQSLPCKIGTQFRGLAVCGNCTGSLNTMLQMEHQLNDSTTLSC